MKENTAVAIYNWITFPVLEIWHQLDLLYINASFHRLRRFTPIIILLITNRKRRSLTPYSKIEEPIRGRHRFENKLGTVTSPRAPKFCCPLITREQRGSRGKPEVATVSPPEGYSGVNGLRRQRENESNQTLGNSPRCWRRAWASISRIPLNSNINSLCLSLNTFSLRPFFVLQIKPILHAFLSFLSRCTTLDCWNISFSIYEFYYSHRNLRHI
jgi:hypothetical protein